MDQKYLHKQTCCVHNIQEVYACWSFLHTCWSFSSECLSLTEAVQKPFKQSCKSDTRDCFFHSHLKVALICSWLTCSVYFLHSLSSINVCLQHVPLRSDLRAVPFTATSGLLFSNLTIFCIANENRFLPVVFTFVILEQANSLGMTLNFCLN